MNKEHEFTCMKIYTAHCRARFSFSLFLSTLHNQLKETVRNGNTNQRQTKPPKQLFGLFSAKQRQLSQTANAPLGMENNKKQQCQS